MATAVPHLLGPCLLWPRSPISATAKLLLHSSWQKPRILYNGRLCLKIALPIRGSRPHIIHDALGPPKPTTEMASRLVQPFSTYDRSVPILYNGLPLPPPLKVAHSHGGMWTPSNTWFLSPTQVLNPNAISIGHFSGLTSVTHRLTDRSRYLVGNKYKYLWTKMWCSWRPVYTMFVLF